MKRNAMVAAGFAACLLLAGPARSETDKVNFLLDWVIYGRATPYFVALEKGFFQSRNIEPRIERGYGSAAGLKRMAAGQADFLLADFGGLILARANEGLRAKMVAVIYSRNGHAVHYLESSGIKSPADLSGKRVAGAPGSTVAALFPAFLRANKVDPETVRIISVDPQALNPVLLAKQFDGMLEFNFNNALLVKEGTKMGLKPAYMMYADHNFRFYANGIITTDSMIAEKPDLVAVSSRQSWKARNTASIIPTNPARCCASMRRASTRTFVLRSSTWSRISRSPTRPRRTGSATCQTKACRKPST